MHLVLNTMAWLNLAFGFSLAVATPFIDDLQVPLFALGALLVAQAAYVIAYSTRVFAPFEPFARDRPHDREHAAGRRRLGGVYPAGHRPPQPSGES